VVQLRPYPVVILAGINDLWVLESIPWMIDPLKNGGRESGLRHPASPLLSPAYINGVDHSNRGAQQAGRGHQPEAARGSPGKGHSLHRLPCEARGLRWIAAASRPVPRWRPPPPWRMTHHARNPSGRTTGRGEHPGRCLRVVHEPSHQGGTS
jgi:hypothetical protein